MYLIGWPLSVVSDVAAQGLLQGFRGYAQDQEPVRKRILPEDRRILGLSLHIQEQADGLAVSSWCIRRRNRRIYLLGSVPWNGLSLQIVLLGQGI